MSVRDGVCLTMVNQDREIRLHICDPSVQHAGVTVAERYEMERAGGLLIDRWCQHNISR